jgi:hypothetical protein
MTPLYFLVTHPRGPAHFYRQIPGHALYTWTGSEWQIAQLAQRIVDLARGATTVRHIPATQLPKEAR